MDKQSDKFCDICGHHLYKAADMLFCIECGQEVNPDYVATLEQVLPMRAKFDADALKRIEEMAEAEC